MGTGAGAASLLGRKGGGRSLCLVLALAAVVRGLVTWSYRPGLFYFDSWLYLGMAVRGHPVQLAPDRPSGYPLLIKGFLSFLGGLTALTAAQHLAGLATASLVYLFAIRSGASRPLALFATAIVALDGYTISLEQYVMPEAFFTLLLMASLLVVATGRRGAWRMAFSGLLLAAATLLRTAGLFVVAVWLLYVLVGRRRARARLAAVAALVVPLLAYAAIYDATTGRFALTESDGWFLYQRVAQIGSCRGLDVPRSARALCAQPALFAPQDPSEYIYSPLSPARVAFGPLAGTSGRVARANGALREFAFAVIAQRPARYAALVGGDLAEFFAPSPRSPGHESLTIELPPPGSPLYWDDPPLREQILPGYKPPAHSLATLARAYVRAVHVPQLLLGIAVSCALLAAALGAATGGPRRIRALAPVLLTLGSGIALLLGSVATTLFRERYLVPAIPLLVTGSVLMLARAGPSIGALRTRLSYRRRRADASADQRASAPAS